LNRRDNLKLMGLKTALVWATPIITSITLPAHAQTSCSMTEVAGSWTFTLGGDALVLVTLNSDGSGQFFEQSIDWSLSGFDFLVTIESEFPALQSDQVFTMIIDGSCDQSVGTANNGDSVVGQRNF